MGATAASCGTIWAARAPERVGLRAGCSSRPVGGIPLFSVPLEQAARGTGEREACARMLASIGGASGLAL